MVDVVAANQQAATVHVGAEPEVVAMAAALARAFYDDPVFTWVLGGDIRRMRVLRGAFELFLRRLWLAEGATFTTAGAVGVAVWEPPGKWRHGQQA